MLLLHSLSSRGRCRMIFTEHHRLSGGQQQPNTSEGNKQSRNRSRVTGNTSDTPKHSTSLTWFLLCDNKEEKLWELQVLSGLLEHENTQSSFTVSDTFNQIILQTSVVQQRTVSLSFSPSLFQSVCPSPAPLWTPEAAPVREPPQTSTGGSEPVRTCWDSNCPPHPRTRRSLEAPSAERNPVHCSTDTGCPTCCTWAGDTDRWADTCGSSLCFHGYSTVRHSEGFRTSCDAFTVITKVCGFHQIKLWSTC